MSSMTDQVPEHIALFYELFPETPQRAWNQHQPNEAGDHCRSCYQPWPCDIRNWVKALRPDLARDNARGQEAQHEGPEPPV